MKTCDLYSLSLLRHGTDLHHLVDVSFLSNPEGAAIEQLQPRMDHAAYGFHRRRKDFIRDDLMYILGQTFFQATSPCDSQFRVDVDDVDACGDCILQICIVGP